MSRNGYAPDYGEAVEYALADKYDMEREDGSFTDARDGDGRPLQFKGTRPTISNGSKNRDGCLTVWSQELLHILADGGNYLAALYDPAAFDPTEYDPNEDDIGDYVDVDEFLLAEKFLTPEDVADAAYNYWGDAHRESKGQRARIPWSQLLDYTPAPTPEPTADGKPVATDGGRSA